MPKYILPQSESLLANRNPLTRSSMETEQGAGRPRPLASFLQSAMFTTVKDINKNNNDKHRAFMHQLLSSMFGSH